MKVARFTTEEMTIETISMHLMIQDLISYYHWFFVTIPVSSGTRLPCQLKKP